MGMASLPISPPLNATLYYYIHLYWVNKCSLLIINNHIFSSFRSPNFSNLCVRKFDRLNVRTMKFDDFIQCCVMLKSLTDAFRKHDHQQTGTVTINYEQVKQSNHGTKPLI